MNGEIRAGATRLDPDEAQGLIPSLATLAELNEFEAANIVQGMNWARRSRRVKSELLEDSLLRELHRQLFGETWTWAGKYRKTEKNIGCEAWKISMNLRNLVEDVKVWIDSQSYTPEEIAARFHHQLVFIHPFANGNGRFARVATDFLCEQQGWRRSMWGAADLAAESDMRKEYIQALQAADRQDFRPLIVFMAR